MDPCSNVSLPSNYHSCTSITELLGALCDSSLSGVSWKRRALGGISRDAVRRSLKKQAYGALLSKLFKEGPLKGPLLSVSKVPCTTPPRNKVLMISFDLRVAGCQDEAERLEDQLDRLPEGPASGLRELNTVLELLVLLAGSAPPPPASFSRDYMRRERPVLRRPPLGGYQSEDLQRLEARAWALVCGEEWGSLGGMCGTLGLMEALPGTGLLALGRRAEGEEKFERETRMSLFGALLHTRTSDLDIRLDLPPVPSNADVTGLAIRVPPYLDQSEDEGFQSASNLTPDSLSEPSPSPEPDVWEAVRTFEPGRRRCWESIGCPPGKREAPYLSEGGREAFDQLYRLWEGEMRVVSSGTPSPLLPLPLDSQTQLVSDLLNVLIGVASTTFPLNQVCVQFDVRPGVCVSGASPESVSRLLADLAQYGTYYLRLSSFALQSAHKKGLVFQAFTGGLRKYLHYYRACVLSTPSTLSLLTFGFLFRKVGRQLRYLSELCCVDGPCGVGQATFPVGVKLLSCLYNEAQSNCSNENYLVLLSLLKSSSEPYTRFVADWVYSGVFRDVYGEFMIQVNEDYLSCRDKNFWMQGYTLISREAEACVPVFLRHMANDVYVCGKTINLLKICCPQHYICSSELPVPRIAVTFSLQEVEEIERDCAVYRGRVERIAKHSAISREEQALRTEQARQELINQVRDSAAKTLETIRGRQVSQRLVEEAKKRERFEELRQHLEQELEWRSAAKKKEQEDDYSFARELRDREKRLKALEEQLEIRARKELIAQYSHLSEEATRRERRALWRVQRMKLDESRAQLLLQDQLHIEALLRKYPLGQTRPPPQSLMPDPEPALVSVDPVGSGFPLGPPRPPLKPSSAAEDPALLSQDTKLTHVLPELPCPGDSQHVEQALQEIGCDLSEGPTQPQPQLPPSDVDYDFSAPFSPLGGMLEPDHPSDLAPAQPQNRSVWGPVIQPAIPLSHPSDSHIPIGENVSEVLEHLPRPSPYGQASQSSFPLGQYAPDVPVATPHKPGLHGHPSQTSAQLAEGAESKMMESCVSCFLPAAEQELTAGSGTAGSVENASQGPGNKAGKETEECQPENQTGVALISPDKTHGSGDLPCQSSPSLSIPITAIPAHVSNTLVTVRDNASVADYLLTQSVKVPHDYVKEGEVVPEVINSQPSLNTHSSGEFVAELTAPLPPPAVHGQISDAHIQIGEYVSHVVTARPSANVHGHSSDSHIAVGENVSDVGVALSTPNVHGHASDSHIRIGELVSDVSPLLPSPSVHGHSSDAHVKVGEFVFDVETQSPRWSKHGHASDSTLQAGCVMSGTEVAASPLPCSAFGHSSDSTLGVGCVVSQGVPLPSPLPGSQYGHSSDSTLGGGCVVSQGVPLPSPLPGSQYGHSSDSTLGVGCVVSQSEPLPSLLQGSQYGHSSDSTLGVGCVVSQSAPLPSPLPGSQYGHSSDSALGGGCVVKDPSSQDSIGLKAWTSSEQLLDEGISSWAASFGRSRGAGSEQDYLLSLASQYEVEPYEDCSSLMMLSPECQLLQQVTRGPWGLPMDPSLRRATDTTPVQLSEMVSLPVLMKHSVTTPLITHVSLVNKAVVDYFFVELGVERHFEALRHFLLMEDGEFAQSLSDLLFEKLASGQTPGELLTPLVLNSILSKALQYSLHGDNALAPNFTFALRFLPETFHPHAPDSLNCLELRYKVDWPLNIIVTDSCMNKYNRLFSFLLQLKHMVWSLRDVWFHLKRTALVKGAGRSVQFRQLQLYRHEMQHFVKVIQGYIANQILQVSWSEFKTKMATVNDLDAIHRTHADYLNRAIFRGLLTEKAAPVMNIIHSIFSLILKFRAQLIAQPWSSQQGEAVHPSFIAMQQSYNTFKYYSHFLFKVVTKLVNRGYQPHLEDFLLRINFNNYYKDS